MYKGKIFKFDATCVIKFDDGNIIEEHRVEKDKIVIVVDEIVVAGKEYVVFFLDDKCVKFNKNFFEWKVTEI